MDWTGLGAWREVGCWGVGRGVECLAGGDKSKQDQIALLWKTHTWGAVFWKVLLHTNCPFNIQAQGLKSLAFFIEIHRNQPAMPVTAAWANRLRREHVLESKKTTCAKLEDTLTTFYS